MLPFKDVYYQATILFGAKYRQVATSKGSQFFNSAKKVPDPPEPPEPPLPDPPGPPDTLPHIHNDAYTPDTLPHIHNDAYICAT